MDRESFLNKITTDLHEIITKRAIEKGYTTTQLLGFLCSVFVGTMVMRGYSQEFFDKTCERMKDQFKNHHLHSMDIND